MYNLRQRKDRPSKRVTRWLLIALSLWQTGPAWAAPPTPDGYVAQQIDVNGTTRHYLLHVPCEASRRTEQLPVLLLFHGGGQTAVDMADRWQSMRDRGYILICPNALKDPTAGDRLWWQHLRPNGMFNPIDLEFIDQLTTELATHVLVDSEQFYASGFSSGGGLTWQLAIHPQLSQRFRGFAPVSMAMNLPQMEQADQTLPDDLPLTVIYIHGTADNNWLTPDRPDPHTTINWLLNHNGNDPLFVQEGCYPDLGSAPYEQQAPDGITVIKKREQTVVAYQHYPAGENQGTPVTFLAIVNGAHSWPRTIDPPDIVNHCRDIDAAEEIVRFWRAHANLP